MKKKIILIICFGYFLFLGCQERLPEWPHSIISNIWIPKIAQDVQYNMIDRSYQVTFKVRECYPGNAFISEMVKEMTKRGWRRLDFDILDSKIILNHKRLPVAVWDHFIDKKGEDVYQWMEDWEDSQKNIIWFGLRYHQKKKNIEKECNLEVIEGYISVDFRP